MSSLIFTLALVGAGVCFAAAAVWLGSKNRLSQPFELSSEKLGLAFKATFVTLFLLLSFALVGIGAYLWATDYEGQIARLKAELTKLDGRISTVEDLRRDFATFHLTCSPNSPGTISRATSMT